MLSAGQLTAIIIVAIVMVAGVLRAAFGAGHERRRRRGRDEELPPTRNDGETLRLREEVKMLKERLAVIERITVEKENSLAREIDQLRDR